MRMLMPIFAATALCACGAVTDSSLDKQGDPAAVQVFEGPVPVAQCGAGSHPETGIQGRTRSVEDVQSGRADLGYSCNLEIVGHEGTRALWQEAWYEDCAYYGVAIGNGGVAVVDATDPANPARTGTLITPAMQDPWESLKVNDKRGLLAAVGPSAAGPIDFDLYDLKEGCHAPQLIGSFPVDAVGHEGEWAPQGTIYYGSTFWGPEITAIDVTETNAPHPIVTLHAQSHGLSISNDGNRAYLAQSQGGNGLRILDITKINLRGADAAGAVEPVEVGSVYWTDGGTAQMTIPVTIKGKPYVIFIDEGGGGTPSMPGMARIIDISDETNPVVVSKLKNEINMADTAEVRAADGGASGFTYQGHYCGVPQREEPGVVACSYFWQGVRVFDIRDPYHPKEIAYFVAGDPGVPGSVAENDAGTEALGAKANASSAIRFVPERGEIWFTDQGHGFYIARFTNGVWPFTN